MIPPRKSISPPRPQNAVQLNAVFFSMQEIETHLRTSYPNEADRPKLVRTWKREVFCCEVEFPPKTKDKK
jgi:hypothetical protein